VTHVWAAVLSTLLDGGSLSEDQSAWAMGEIMRGEATAAQVAGFAVALRAKGETAEEVAGLVRAMLSHAEHLEVSGPAVDTCGTGGDRAHTVNISTMAALVVRAAGGRVVKHGNRAASSDCGSADLLEHLGVVIDLLPDGVRRCVDEVGIGFCFAPVFHPALRHSLSARRELGIPTVFNFLGPLTNPAQPPAQVVGVADARMAPVLASVLARRGTSALVVHGQDGLDEFTTAAPSRVWVVRSGEVTEVMVDPTRLGLRAAGTDELRGGDKATNAEKTVSFLAGTGGAVRDAVLLNAAAALVALDGPDATELEDQLAAALPRAAGAVDDGTAAQVLADWVSVSRAAQSS
jgi:anthranilate phosphoribosyltransferase